MLQDVNLAKELFWKFVTPLDIREVGFWGLEDSINTTTEGFAMVPFFYVQPCLLYVFVILAFLILDIRRKLRLFCTFFRGCSNSIRCQEL